VGASVSFMRVGGKVGLEEGIYDGNLVEGTIVGLEEGELEGHSVKGLEVGFVAG